MINTAPLRRKLLDLAISGKLVPIGGEEKRIDLVFYNIILRCYVLVDLKPSKLTSRDIGQIDAYRRIFAAGRDDRRGI